MDRHIVIGTAGHIDHGKTALVRALTGVDTDRWAEEKRRGITIDLGFAPLRLADDLAASIVDVPGHEGFVRNMLAGATGIDLALLVVAADEGIMPQTEEHLAILELLGVTWGVPAVTKTDLVEPAWLDLVVEELQTRLYTSPVRWTAPVLTSAERGTGLEELRGALTQGARDIAPRAVDDLFRLPVDRVFSLPGAGTVVTGTTWSGSVTKGDLVTILPHGIRARIRSVEVHGAAAEAARPGRRTALALLDVHREQIARGDVVVDAVEWRPTTRFSCAVELLPAARRPLRRRERVRVHLGTAAVTGRFLGRRDLRPGERLDRAVLEVERPLVVRAGDRFVLRGASPVTTIGGGAVWDPFPGEEPPAATLPALVRAGGPSGVETAHLPLRLPLRRGEAERLLSGLPDGVVRVGNRVVARDAVNDLASRLEATVEAYHASHPLEEGMSLQALRAGAGAPEEVADLALRRTVELGRLVVGGAVVRTPAWSVSADPATARAVEQLALAISARRWHFPSIAELEAEFGVESTRPLLAVLIREGRVVALGREHCIDRGALQEFETSLQETLRELGSALPSQLRTRTGLTRKHLIPLLEWADRSGLTRREGDARVLVP